MTEPLLYSVNAYLAWAINERYYAGSHYVWCTAAFDTRAEGAYGAHSSTPPSSTPKEIFGELQRAAAAGDKGSEKIASVRVGIVNGAHTKLSDGKISSEIFDEIMLVIDRCEIRDFRPLLYLLPREGVADKLKPVPVDQRAHPLSMEYIIENLSKPEFDVIEFP